MSINFLISHWKRQKCSGKKNYDFYCPRDTFWWALFVTIVIFGSALYTEKDGGNIYSKASVLSVCHFCLGLTSRALYLSKVTSALGVGNSVWGVSTSVWGVCTSAPEVCTSTQGVCTSPLKVCTSPQLLNFFCRHHVWLSPNCKLNVVLSKWA